MHDNDVIMGAIASQITSLTIVYSIVYSDADQRKHQSSVSLAFVRGIHRGPVNSPHKWPVTRKMFPFDDVIMDIRYINNINTHSSCLINDWLTSAPLITPKKLLRIYYSKGKTAIHVRPFMTRAWHWDSSRITGALWGEIDRSPRWIPVASGQLIGSSMFSLL